MTEEQRGNLEWMTAAIDTLESAMFHLRQSDLDDEGKLGINSVAVALENLKRRRSDAANGLETNDL